MGFNDLPSVEGREMLLIDALVETGLAKSKSEARTFITGGGVTINGDKVSDLSFMLTKSIAIEGKFIVIRRGKKLYALVRY